MELRNLKPSISCSSLWFLSLVCLALFDTRHLFQAVSSEINRFPSPNGGVYDNPEYDDPRHQILSLENLFPLDPNGLELESYKRSSAFFPLRGKKPSEGDNFGDFDDGDPEMKRGSHFFPLRGKKLHDELKRASSFMPMRGRKDDDEVFSNHDDDKRVSSFMPMRGKKSAGGSQQFQKSGTYPNDVVSDVRYQYVAKRKSAFMPVGGRKDDSTLPMSGNANSIGMNEVEHKVKKRSTSLTSSTGSGGTQGIDSEMNLLMPEHITSVLLDKKSVPHIQDRRYNNSTINNRTTGWTLKNERAVTADDIFIKDGDIPEIVDLKRASSFMPMRGRRMDEIATPWEETNEIGQNFKRASSFMPMRGRRINDAVSYGDPWEETRQAPKQSLKRASSFMPMRGRRLPRTVTEDLESMISSKSKKRLYSMPIRDRRRVYDGPGEDSSAFYGSYPYLIAGIGSSLMRRPYGNNKIKLQALRGRKRRFKINWDSVKRAFHAARGKRVDNFVSSLKDNYIRENEFGSSSTRFVQGPKGRMKRSPKQSRLLF